MAIFVANPLTMFFWNWFSPQEASEFIYTWSGSGKKLKAFYRFLANLMPFSRNKFWMSYVDIRQYSPRQQARYYLEYDTTGEMLRKLDIEAVDMLFKTQKNNQLIREQIYEFRRPSDAVITSLFLGKNVRELRKFLPFGPFGMNVATTLINLAMCEVLESNPDCQKFPLTEYLADYVRAYRMDKEFLEKLRDFQGPAWATKVWFDRIEPAIEAFQQRLYVREQSKNGDVRTWRNFCKSTKIIYPEAQKVMNVKQHLIFYETGHRLAPEVVLHFLKDGYPARFDMMLRWEKDKGVFKGEAKEIIDDNPELYNVYQRFKQNPKPDENKKSQRNFHSSRGGDGKKKPAYSGTKSFRKHGTVRNI
ncbi:MAG: hypothetical protein IJ852_02545 [Alphaproteobacteria bacterium]|nr:hypothetical protein [Alphaproteobacteria bacterium]